MSRTLHLTNPAGRNASVGVVSSSAPAAPRLGLPGTELEFRRFIAATESALHEALIERFGADYGAALVEGDPEIDMERVGQRIEQTQFVLLNADGRFLDSDPTVVEVVTNPDGTEKERREPVDSVANVNETVPVRWSGRKIPIADAVRRFAFRRRVQLCHVDGLTFDFLRDMAPELEASRSLMIIGSGDKGTGPLVFQANGRPYRGFLEGRTQGESYQLILHLSEMELKRPWMPPEGEDGE
jgi:hypothetical protein